VLVVDEGREAELELRDPEVERVVAAGERVGGPLHVEELERVVVVARHANDDLGEEIDRVEEHDRKDDEPEDEMAAVESAEAREDQRVGEGRAGDPVGATRRASRRCAVANSVVASAFWPSERRAMPRL